MRTRRPVAVLHIAGVDRRPDQQAESIGDDKAFAVFDFLARIFRAGHHQQALDQRGGPQLGRQAALPRLST
jgi:hypothetical protein